MLSDRDALLAAIRANPEEDTPRLMFADWLDESGDPDRAEFIRLQCEQARLADDGSDSHAVYEFLRDRDYVTRPSADWTQIDDGIHRRIAIALRVDDLIKRHGEAWQPKQPKKLKVEWLGFHRGFAHRVTVGDVRRLAEIAERFRAVVPAITLVSGNFTPRFVEQLAAAGLLGWISGLDLHGDCADGLRSLGHHPEAAGVRSIRVEWYGIATDLASALADPPHWTGLHTLDLSEATLSGTDTESIFRAHPLRTLKRLRLRGFHDWSAENVSALSASQFTELLSLQIAGTGMGDAIAESLADRPQFARLRTLDLPSNNMSGNGLTALLTSPRLANIAFLGLEDNRCTGLNAKRMAEATPGRLRMLHCHGSHLIASDVRKLARCPRLRSLWYLDLDANGLGPTAVCELVQGFGKFCPPIVWLTHNRIGDRGAEHLAKWKAATALRVLHLRYNSGMTDAGVRALLDSPYLANLDGLGVSTTSDELSAQLRARFRHHEVNY